MSLLELPAKCKASIEAGHGFVALLSSEGFDTGGNDMLTRSERQRAERYRSDVDRKNFILGRTALRALIMDGDSGKPIRFGTRGKPYVNGGPAFNLSHSGSLVALAIGVFEPVGIDVEVIENFEPNLVDAVCSYAEKYWILRQPSRVEAFYRCWTRKEALLKAAGLGLVLDLSNVDCSTAVNSPIMEQPIEVRLCDLSRYLVGSYAAYAAFPASTTEICVAVLSSSGHLRFEQVAADGIPYPLPGW